MAIRTAAVVGAGLAGLACARALAAAGVAATTDPARLRECRRGTRAVRQDRGGAR